MNVRRAIAGGVVGVIMGAGACSSAGTGDAQGTSPSSGPGSVPGTTAPGAPLTLAQATTLAQTLFENYDRGGASIEATIPYGPAATFRFTGDVDWREHRGHGQLETVFADSRPSQTTEVTWTRDAVAITDPQGTTTHALDPQASPLDRVLAFVDSLESDRPENAQLLQQGDARFLGSEGDGAAAVDRFRAGARTTYWVRREDGRMVRVEAAFNGFAGPVVIEVRDPGPRSVALPPALATVGTGPAPASGPGSTSP